MPETNGEQMVERNPDGTIKEGSVLNPKGRPVGAKHMTTLLKEAITRVAEGEEEPDDLIIVKKTIEDAKKGDHKARDLVWSYLDGKPPQAKEDPGSEDNPMHMTVTIKQL